MINSEQEPEKSLALKRKENAPFSPAGGKEEMNWVQEKVFRRERHLHANYFKG